MHIYKQWEKWKCVWDEPKVYLKKTKYTSSTFSLFSLYLNFKIIKKKWEQELYSIFIKKIKVCLKCAWGVLEVDLKQTTSTLSLFSLYVNQRNILKTFWKNSIQNFEKKSKCAWSVHLKHTFYFSFCISIVIKPKNILKKLYPKIKNN